MKWLNFWRLIGKIKKLIVFLSNGSSPKIIPGIVLVGVGPGNPSLMTLAAIEEIKAATVVAYPSNPAGGVGMAGEIASKFIEKKKKRLLLFFPMVSNEEQRKNAWREASNKLASAVLEGERVAFLCQGDVSLFSTSSYLLLDLKDRFPTIPLNLIPGVTSISAAAAIASFPLALQDEQLLIAPTPNQPIELKSLLLESIEAKKTLVLLKIGSRWIWVKPLLEKMGLLEYAIFAQKVGWSDQEVVQASFLSEEIKPYFSLLLIRKNWPEVLP